MASVYCMTMKAQGSTCAPDLTLDEAVAIFAKNNSSQPDVKPKIDSNDGKDSSLYYTQSDLKIIL